MSPMTPKSSASRERHEREEAAVRDRVEHVLDVDRVLAMKSPAPAIPMYARLEVADLRPAPRLVPWNSIRPPLRSTYVRSATSIVRAAFCSTSRIVTPSCCSSCEDLEHAVDHQRREAECRLVEEQELRPREQRASDRQLLLLPARELRARPSPSSRRAPGSARASRVDVRLRRGAVPADGRADLEVLADGEAAEDATALRHERDARRRISSGDTARRWTAART